MIESKFVQNFLGMSMDHLLSQCFLLFMVHQQDVVLERTTNGKSFLCAA